MDSKNRQLFDKPITQLIESRTSTRTFIEQPLSAETKEKIKNYLAEVQDSLGPKVRFKFIDNIFSFKNSTTRLGTYGVVKGASSFIAAAVEPGEQNLIDLGYAFEKVILYATALGVGTCWLGATFKKAEFAKVMELSDKEQLAVIAPVGYAKENRSLIDSFIRFTAGSKNRKGWAELFFQGNFKCKLSAAAAGKYSEALEMVRLAPSASNKQPWRIVKEHDTFHFYLSHPKDDKNTVSVDLQKIDIGIAMAHFALTMQEKGLPGEWFIQKPKVEDVPPSVKYIVSWAEKE